jgi:hypothetical protein
MRDGAYVLVQEPTAMERPNAATHVEAADLKHAGRRGLGAAARFGYVAHGVVYGLVGALALLAAFGLSGGRLTDGKGAVHRIGETGWGVPLLWAIGVGVACYALWNVIRAVLDPDGLGSSGKALAKRIGYGASAISHALLSIYAIQLARGIAEGSSQRQTIAQVLDLPGGRVAIAIAGLGAIVFGAMEVYAAWSNKVGREFDGGDLPPARRRLALRIARIGRGARGCVFPIIGTSLIVAAIDANPSEAHSFADALRTVLSQPFGRVLLGVVSAGLIAYGIHMLFVARYGRVAVA